MCGLAHLLLRPVRASQVVYQTGEVYFNPMINILGVITYALYISTKLNIKHSLYMKGVML